MTNSKLRTRWSTPEGRTLSRDVLEWLRGGPQPRGLDEHEDRVDLRGLTWAAPARNGGSVTAGGSTFSVLSNVEHISAHWEGLDLSGASLPSLRFTDSSITGCRFEKASCPDLRLWNSRVEGSSFDGANLRGSALGTWHDGKGNYWANVSFDNADLRDALFSGGEIRGCAFRGSKLGRACFRQA